MGGGFYKVNNEVLKLDIKKHKVEILFNHYLMQKENLQRLKGGLPKGQFYLSKHDVSINLEVSLTKAQRLITKFIKKNIIIQVKRGINQEKLSIYKYVAINEKSGLAIEPVSEPVSEPAEYSNTNSFKSISEPASGQYKKEILKIIIYLKIYYESTGVDLVIEKKDLLNLYKPYSHKCMK